MNNPLILFTLCIMASMTSFAQSELKNGVYEFSYTTDSIFETFTKFANTQVLLDQLKGTTTTRRTLIVKNDTVFYTIANREKFGAGSRGTWDNYFLKLENTDTLYTAKNENIALIVTVINNQRVEVEIITGQITSFYSGGQYFTETVALPPEKQTLTFVRELTAEDEEMLTETQK